MKVKLIAFDLDGTLLRDDHSVSEYSFSVLKKCREKNILLAIATARSYASAESYIEIINPDIVITNGGATCYYKDKLFFKRTISIHDSNCIINKALQDKAVNYIRFVGLNEYFSNAANEVDRSNYYLYSDFSSPIRQESCKISLYTNSELIVNDYSLHNPLINMFRFTNKMIYIICHKEASKEMALFAIAKKIKINLKTEAISFGDDILDIGMLNSTTISVAPQNSSDCVKNIVTNICLPSNSDGVAKFVEKVILNK